MVEPTVTKKKFDLTGWSTKVNEDQIQRINKET